MNASKFKKGPFRVPQSDAFVYSFCVAFHSFRIRFNLFHRENQMLRETDTTTISIANNHMKSFVMKLKTEGEKKSVNANSIRYYGIQSLNCMLLCQLFWFLFLLLFNNNVCFSRKNEQKTMNQAAHCPYMIFTVQSNRIGYDFEPKMKKKKKKRRKKKQQMHFETFENRTQNMTMSLCAHGAYAYSLFISIFNSCIFS